MQYNLISDIFSDNKNNEWFWINELSAVIQQK